MTAEEQAYEDAKTVQKEAIKVYINDADPAISIVAIQMLLSGFINNAGSLENLVLAHQALAARLGPRP